MTANIRDARAINEAIAASVRKAIDAKGSTLGRVAQDGGLSVYVLRRRLAGLTSFKVTELAHIAHALDASGPTELIADALAVIDK